MIPTSFLKQCIVEVLLEPEDKLLRSIDKNTRARKASTFIKECIAEVVIEPHRRMNIHGNPQRFQSAHLIKECVMEVLKENLTEGFDPLSDAGPNPTQENPYPEWNSKMRQMEEENSFSLDKPEDKDLVGANSFWMDRSGNFIKLGRLTHWQWAQAYLEKNNIPVENNSSCQTLYKHGFIRVKVEGNVLHFEGRPNSKQTSKLKNTAIKRELKLYDDIKKGEVELNESDPHGRYAQEAGATPFLSTFTEIRNKYDPAGTKHDLTLKCIKCGTTQTCKCSKPKRKMEGICDKCAQTQKSLNEIAAQHPLQSTAIKWKCPHCSGTTKILIEIESPSDYISCSDCDHCKKEISDPRLDVKIYNEVISHFAGRSLLK